MQLLSILCRCIRRVQESDDTGCIGHGAAMETAGRLRPPTVGDGVSKYEILLLQLIRDESLPEPEQEHRFCERRWRFDFAWPERMVAAEVEGAIWVKGRHTRGSGYQKDCRKYNAATLLGWRVFRFTPAMINQGEALETLKEALS
jgi:very-short-patch-repair endonuclease